MFFFLNPIFKLTLLRSQFVTYVSLLIDELRKSLPVLSGMLRQVDLVVIGHNGIHKRLQVLVALR